jgi:ribonuclease HI
VTETAATRTTESAERPWHIYVVFDGGSKGNPGKGYGSYVYKGIVSQTEVLTVEYPGQTTNNEAEYRTMINALRAVLADLKSAGTDPSGLKVTVRSDSKLVVEQVNGRWKVKKAELRPLVSEAQTLLRQFKSWDLGWHPRSESVRILGH